MLHSPWFQGESGGLQYSIVAADSSPSDVSAWFFLNPTTGAIFVIANLKQDESQRTEYIVSRR